MACKNQYRGAFIARVYTYRTISCFVATNMPNPLLLVQKSCFRWFRAISSTHPTRCENLYRRAFDWMFQNSRTLDILLERFQCTPLGPKLTFWVFSHRFGALKSLFCFAPHTLRLKLMFWVVSRHFFAAPDSLWKSVSCALNARVYAPETISCFVATNMPNPLFQSKTHVLGGSMPFRSHTWHVAKTGIEVHLIHEFMPL